MIDDALVGGFATWKRRCEVENKARMIYSGELWEKTGIAKFIVV